MKKIEKEILGQFRAGFGAMDYPDPLLGDLKMESEQELRKKTEAYIQDTKDNDLHTYLPQQTEFLDSKEMNRYFRSQKRKETNVLTLQYLVSFMSKLPQSEEIIPNLDDPFHQFKGFVLFNVDQLSQPDVLNTTFLNLTQQGVLQGENIAPCRKWVFDKKREIENLVQTARNSVKNDWKILFTALMYLSLFWFSVKKYDTKDIRRTDRYIYHLCLILLKKYQ